MAKVALALALLIVFTAVAAADASDCQIANILFGKVRVEIIPHNNNGENYETAVVFGADFDSKRFASGRIVGQISSRERDGSLPIKNIGGVIVASISRDLRLETLEDACDKNSRVQIRKVSPTSYAVMNENSIVGTIDGRLPQ